LEGKILTSRIYEHLIKPLGSGRIDWNKTQKGQREYNHGPGNAAQKVWLTGRDHLEGMNLSFGWGLYNGLGNWETNQSLHIHPYPECQIFVGLDPANISYLGAEIDCCLGQEQEIYSFNEPTVMIVPAGLPHGPVVTKRIFSPQGFGSYAVALSAMPKTSLWETNTKFTKSTGKYSHLLKSLKSFILTEHGKFKPSRFTPQQLSQRAEMSNKNEMRLGPGNADHLTWMFGSDLGVDANMDWGFFSKPGLWHRGVGAHLHAVDEVLVYVGTDPEDIDYFGAEIEIDMGREHERYVINQPSVVICPAGVAHAPIITRWVDRPFAFFSINLSPESVMKFID
jgi:hypothetical protein